MPGSQRVKSYLTLTDGTVLINEMTIYVVGADLCREDLEAYKCDMDDDDLPDMCDDDIDGDGVKNCLRLLLAEQVPSCAIDDKNIDTDRLLACHIKIGEGADFDNCPFIKNEDQADEDGDTYGDVCDTGNEQAPPEDNDGDGDGIEDEADACPTIPESKNGIEDGDGCPELPESLGKNPYVEAGNCTQCPCPYADYGSELWKGDRIRAILLDEAGSVIYRYTKPKIIEKNIADLVNK